VCILWASVAYYVDKLINLDDRSTLCKIRISTHPLAIEKGRYLHVSRDQRFLWFVNVM
jgi:hypothetical protein